MNRRFFILNLIASVFISANILLSQGITAKHGLNKIDSLINTINPRAQLLWLWDDSLNLDGTSSTWNYKYGDYSDELHTYYFLHSTIDSVIFDSLNHLVIPGSMYIDSVWIDSDSAIVIAENKGGKEFRESRKNNCKIFARLGKPLVPYSTNNWYFFYTSLDNPSDDFYIYLNAVGDSILGIQNSETIPDELILDQNYPNPFNPNTTINYSIPNSGIVELKVYNNLGKEIKTFSSEFKYSGKHVIEFNGNSLASGIYYYQLRFGSFVKVKKMILLK